MVIGFVGVAVFVFVFVNIKFVAVAIYIFFCVNCICWGRCICICENIVCGSGHRFVLLAVGFVLLQPSARCSKSRP